MATTHLDSDGERLTPEQITSLFHQSSDNIPLIVNHDMSSGAIARAFNKKLVKLDDGELAITMDIEVLNEEQFDKYRGFSIGFIRSRKELGQGTPTAKVMFNSRQFNFDEVVQEIDEVVAHRYAVEVVEKVEKSALLTAAIIIVGFIAEGFFSAGGADLYSALKRLRRKDDAEAPVEVHYHYHLHEHYQPPVVVLIMDPQCTSEDLRKIGDETIRKEIIAVGGENSFQRLVMRVEPGSKIKVLHKVDAHGLPTDDETHE